MHELQLLKKRARELMPNMPMTFFNKTAIVLKQMIHAEEKKLKFEKKKLKLEKIKLKKINAIKAQFKLNLRESLVSYLENIRIENIKFEKVNAIKAQFRLNLRESLVSYLENKIAKEQASQNLENEENEIDYEIDEKSLHHLYFNNNNNNNDLDDESEYNDNGIDFESHKKALLDLLIKKNIDDLDYQSTEKDLQNLEIENDNTYPNYHSDEQDIENLKIEIDTNNPYYYISERDIEDEKQTNKLFASNNKIIEIKEKIEKFQQLEHIESDPEEYTPIELKLENLNQEEMIELVLLLKIREGWRFAIRPGNNLKRISWYPLTTFNIEIIQEIAIQQKKEEKNYEVDNDNPDFIQRGFTGKGSNAIFVEMLFYGTLILSQKKNVPKKKNNSGGAFFPFLNHTRLNLVKYGIFASIIPENYKDNCLMLALIQSGLLTEIQIQELKQIISVKVFPVGHLIKIANLLKIKIFLKQDLTKKPKSYGAYQTSIHLGLIKEHYFYNDKTIYNSFAIKNYNEIKNYVVFNNVKSILPIRRENLPVDAYTVISLALLNNLFTPIKLSTENILKTQYTACPEIVTKGLDLNFTKNCIKTVKLPETQRKFTKIFYADFESCTEGDIHTPYMCCVVTNNQPAFSYDKSAIPDEKTFVGVYSAVRLLEYLPHNSVCYFHNLGYDIQFIMQYLLIRSIIKSGSQVKILSGLYMKKTLTFKDSYSMISSPLRNFKNIFKLNIQKEIMPYGAYNSSTINKVDIPFEYALNCIKPHIHNDECKKDCMINNVDDFKILAQDYVTNGKFHHMLYAKFYCLQDCRVLMKGFSIFRGWIAEAFKLDCVQFVSLPSLSYRYLDTQGCFVDVNALGMTPRLFIQNCVKGGRCMVRDNEKWHCYDELDDFDAVSLYPSAMARMGGFLKGVPKILEDNQLTMEFLNLQTGYFVEIANVVVNKKLHFPLQSQKDKNGIRNYVNDFTENIYIDKIALEDFIEFQGATFTIVKGYYFNEGRNNEIEKTIKYCFEKRAAYKREKNPIESVFKLLMNASYGKLIQRAIKTEQKFTNTKKQHEKFLDYNYNYCLSYTELAKDKHVYDMQKSIESHFTVNSAGCEILSMSKHIMNEVICLAEDLDIKIYYTDTDSMHIERKNDALKRLSEAYYAKYGRVLIGNNMNQFHSDFSGGDYSVESYFLGKKAYIDQLDTGHLHIRMKGICNAAIIDRALIPLIGPLKIDPNHKVAGVPHNKSIGGAMILYNQLINNNTVEFDLAKNQASFVRNKDYTYSTNAIFLRSVSFKK